MDRKLETAGSEDDHIEGHVLDHSGIIEQVLTGRFEIDCPMIELTPSFDGSSTRKYLGPGLIRLAEGPNNFEAKIFLTQEFSIWSDYQSIMSTRYDLLAIDMEGNEWTANNVRLWLNSSEMPRVITHAITVTTSRDIIYLEPTINEVMLNLGPVNYVLPNENGRRMWLNAISDVPLGFHYQPAAIFNIGGFRIHLSQDDRKCLIARVESEEEIPETFIDRLIQSLQFVYGHALNRQVFSSKNSETKQLTTVFQRHMDRTYPPQSIAPVQIDRGNDVDDFWRMFETFMRYTTNSESIDSDYILQSVWSVIWAWHASVESIGLLICVAIEGILKEKFTKYGIISEEFAEDIAVITPCIDAAPIAQRSKKRIKGFLPRKDKFSPREVLEKFSKKGLITNDLAELWAKTRNTRAHGHNLGPLDIDRVIALDQDNYKLLQLYYFLIFLVIDYQGSYTDYRQANLPNGIIHKVELDD